MSKLEVDKIIPQSGTTVTIGDSGDTTNIVGTLQNNGAELTGDITSVVAGTGLSGGATSGAATLNIEAAQPTITSLGTITTFRSTGIDDNADALAMTIDSSENIGIGTTSPGTKLEVVGTGVNGIELGQQSDGNDSSRLFFTNSTNVCAIRSTGGSLKFSTGATINSSSGDDRVIIHSNGVMSAANGIALGVGANNTASNVLNDYEEGSFTPAYAFDSGSVAMQSGSRGHYVKVGNLVHFQIYMATDSISSPSGDATITGLPFTTGDTSSSSAAIGLLYRFGTDFDGDLKIRVGQDSTVLSPFKNASNSTSSTRFQGSDFTSGTAYNNLHVAGCYATF